MELEEITVDMNDIISDRSRTIDSPSSTESYIRNETSNLTYCVTKKDIIFSPTQHIW